MALSPTTTLRVPTELRDKIAQLAERRRTTMLEVVTDAVHRLSRDEWWAQVRDALDGLDSEQAASYQEESRALENAAADGLGAG